VLTIRTWATPGCPARFQFNCQIELDETI
jgi:hypothetical protein